MGDICYKVVGKRTRYGTNLSYYRINNSNKGWKFIVDKITSYGMWKYFPKYNKGKTVVAPEGSLGLMVFAEKDDALDFIRSLSVPLTKTKLKVVKTECFNQLPYSNISAGCAFNPIKATFKLLSDLTEPPPNTLFYERLIVLE